MPARRYDGSVQIWDPWTGKLRTSLRDLRINAMCAVTVEGRQLLAVGGYDGAVRIWDPATGEQCAALEGHLSAISAVCSVTVNGQESLASASRDSTVRVWNALTATCILVLPYLPPSLGSCLGSRFTGARPGSGNPRCQTKLYSLRGLSTQRNEFRDICSVALSSRQLSASCDAQ